MNFKEIFVDPFKIEYSLKKILKGDNRVNPYVITWGVSDKHGWGLVGLHLLIQMHKRGNAVFFSEAPSSLIARKDFRKVASQYAHTTDFFKDALSAPTGIITLPEQTVLHGLGNQCFEPPQGKRLWGDRNIALIAFEDTTLTDEVVARANQYDMVVTHSLFNQNMMIEAGVKNVEMVWQGIDPFELKPHKRTNRFGDKFVIFSGGKIEYRKGQDLILKAFKIFNEKYPDSFLMTNWASYWPEASLSVNESSVLDHDLKIIDGKLDIEGWVAANGISRDAFCDLGFVERDQISQNFAEADVALFSNRCEGATNLVAKEAMFCRVPTILSANTGHVDLIPNGRSVCLPLERQTQVSDKDGSRQNWMDSDVDEMVAHLEWVYHNREKAKTIANEAFRFIGKERIWSKFAEDCLDLFE
ncbi:glycosyltransferase family 4 protein [Terasakiella sp. A23]|uniref:glycosyltransferase family 4 protein n=1 Tax=Terasakiella sp. FCG-A23 TaxID=3080561 RepID=UPI002954321A|nr:glycosyltransferase family 4 protein [Terasakiella sp. A23]MDV7341556.1 glycosyltransferase family 4 protein [Terasakiella sp. A23]